MKLYIIFGVAAFVIIVFLVWFLSTRNAFIKEQEDIRKLKSDISNYKEQRNKYLSDATQIAAIACGTEIKGYSEIENQSGAKWYENLMFLGQRYPQLQGSSAYTEALKKTYNVNEDIAAAKTLLNSGINAYNTHLRSFPALIVASVLGYEQEPYVDEENSEENKIDETGEPHFASVYPAEEAEPFGERNQQNVARQYRRR